MTIRAKSAGSARDGPDRLHNVSVQQATATPASGAGSVTGPVDEADASTEADAELIEPDARPRGLQVAGVLLVPLVSILLLPASVWLDLNAPATGPGVELTDGPGWPWTLNGVVLGVLASVILLRDRRQKFGWALAFFALFWATDGLSQSYVRTGMRADEAWPGMTFALWFLHRFGAYLSVVTAVLLLLFPTGRFLPGRWGVASRITLAAMVVNGAVFLVIPAEGRITSDLVPADVDVDPTTLPALEGHGDQMADIALAIGVATFLITMLTVIVRYRRSTGLMRDRMRWLLWSVVVIVAVLLAGTVVHLPGLVGVFVVIVLPAAAMTVAIVQPTLVPIQDLLARTLVLAVILTALAAADIAVLALLTIALDDELTQAQVVAVVLAVAVLLYGPLRQRLSTEVQRLMLGKRGNRYDAVAGLASTLETTDDTGEQLAAVARAVASAFAVSFVSVEVDRGHGERLVTTYGDRPAQVRTLPITYRGAGVGRLVLPARGVRSRLTARDEQLLGDLVRQAATAARTSQLAEEVQHSRERLVTAREEERRRIRRDLHDGLGPALSGVVFQLEAARMTVTRDPAAAHRQLEGITEHVQGIVGDVRRLVHDLRPPALDDRGLVGALKQQADRLEVPLEVAAPDLDGRLPAAVEVAAYRIVGEALTNVARHARASRAVLRLDLVDDSLVVEVADDGVGIAEDRESGVGLVGLRERAAELGGTAEVTCPPGAGTVVRAHLPLRSAS